MPRRPLGRTGVEVSLVGLGGSHIGGKDVPANEAVRLIRAALDAGMNFMDNSWDYHDGESEKRLGRALKDGYRQKAFVMTKVDGRSKKEAARQLDESLKRLQVEEIDLLQHHEVIPVRRHLSHLRRRRCDGGVSRSEEGRKIRFIGFTGHKDPEVHLHMLQTAKEHDFRFDAVQLPLNVLDAHYRSFEKKVLPELVADGIAVLGMKSLASGAILKAKSVSAIECLHYAMNLSTSVVITGIDSQKILDQALEAARTFQPLSSEEVAAILEKSKPASKHGAYELFKTTSAFDATAQHPEWLGEESARTKQLSG